MDIRLLLIVQEDSARRKYIEELDRYGVHIFVSPSFQDFSKEICEQSFHGILLDLPTKIKALKQNRNYVYGLLENFPVSQLRINEITGEIRCLHASQESGITLMDFIDNECRCFIPRMIRADIRKTVHFNVRLSKSSDMISPELSFSTNVSKGGCFVFSLQQWAIDDDVWLEILELSDPDPIQGIVRHFIPWGSTRRIPGIGVEFQKISASQQSELISS